ncbi:MAG: hypothetical protein ACI4UM_04935 [Succinivibrio sp.]
MQLSYRHLFTDENRVEFSVLKTENTNCLCIQGDKKLERRIRKAYSSAQFFFPKIKENFFEPVSVNVQSERVSALFSYRQSGFLSDFLKVVPEHWQYATGKKLGRVLKEMHSTPLTQKQLEQANNRHSSYMSRIASYVADLPHFKNDRYAMEAISTRYDYFSVFRPVMRYGSLKHQKILITDDSTLLILPSYSYGPGCMCEDFASLECETAGIYPVFCAGVIDGYFSSAIPAKFWMHFALYSALYSLWKCALKARGSKEKHILMQQNCDRIREDFSNFAKPVPSWYSNGDLEKIKNRALKQAL